MCHCFQGKLSKSGFITSDGSRKERSVKMEVETVNIQSMECESNSLISSYFSEDDEEDRTPNDLDVAMQPKLPPRKYIEESSVSPPYNRDCHVRI